MRGRVVAEPPVERDRPHHAEHAEQLEGAPPRHEAQDPHDQQRRERSAPSRHQPQRRLGAFPVPARQPDREHARQRRIAAGFAGAEQRARDDQRRRVECPAGGGREERPPQHDPHQHAARPDPIGEPAARNLEERVGPSEDAQHPSHLDGGEAEIPADRAGGLADADAIDIGDHGEAERKRQGDVAGAGWRGGHRDRRRHVRSCRKTHEAPPDGFAAVGRREQRNGMDNTDSEPRPSRARVRFADGSPGLAVATTLAAVARTWPTLRSSSASACAGCVTA